MVQHILESSVTDHALRSPIDHVDGRLVDVARNGHYSDAVSEHVPAAWVDACCEREADRLRVAKPLRASYVFAVHDVLPDSPFSNLDVVSCHTVLIDPKPEVQTRPCEMFHSSLATRRAFLSRQRGVSERVVSSPRERVS